MQATQTSWGRESHNNPRVGLWDLYRASPEKTDSDTAHSLYLDADAHLILGRSPTPNLAGAWTRNLQVSKQVRCLYAIQNPLCFDSESSGVPSEQWWFFFTFRSLTYHKGKWRVDGKNMGLVISNKNKYCSLHGDLPKNQIAWISIERLRLEWKFAELPSYVCISEHNDMTVISVIPQNYFLQSRLCYKHKRIEINICCIPTIVCLYTRIIMMVPL